MLAFLKKPAGFRAVTPWPTCHQLPQIMLDEAALALQELLTWWENARLFPSCLLQNVLGSHTFLDNISQQSASLCHTCCVAPILLWGTCILSRGTQGGSGKTPFFFHLRKKKGALKMRNVVEIMETVRAGLGKPTGTTGGLFARPSRPQTHWL